MKYTSYPYLKYSFFMKYRTLEIESGISNRCKNIHIPKPMIWIKKYLEIKKRDSRFTVRIVNFLLTS